MNSYMDAISKFQHVPLSATRSFCRDPSHVEAPFDFLDWSTGCLHFRFQQVREWRRCWRQLG